MTACPVLRPTLRVLGGGRHGRLKDSPPDDNYLTPEKTVNDIVDMLAPHLKGARVLCPADGPNSYFRRVLDKRYDDLGLNGLYAVNYADGVTADRPSVYERDGKDEAHEYGLDDDDGDMFRSPTTGRLLDKADTIISNPPFSLVSGYRLSKRRADGTYALNPGVKRTWADMIGNGRRYAFIGGDSTGNYAQMSPLINDMRQVHLGKVDYLRPDGSTTPLSNTYLFTNFGNIGPKYDTNAYQRGVVPKRLTKFGYPHTLDRREFDPNEGIQIVPSSTYLEYHNPKTHTILGRYDPSVWGQIPRSEDDPSKGYKDKYRSFVVANNDILHDRGRLGEYVGRFQNPNMRRYLADRGYVPYFDSIRNSVQSRLSDF